VDCELYSFSIVVMQENLWSNGTCHAFLQWSPSW